MAVDHSNTQKKSGEIRGQLPLDYHTARLQIYPLVRDSNSALRGSGQYGLSIHRMNSTTANEISSLPNDDKSRLIDLNSCPQPGQVFAVVEILCPHSLHFAIAIVGPSNSRHNVTLDSEFDSAVQ